MMKRWWVNGNESFVYKTNKTKTLCDDKQQSGRAGGCSMDLGSADGIIPCQTVNMEEAGLICSLSHCWSSFLSSSYILIQWVAETYEAWALRGTPSDHRATTLHRYWRSRDNTGGHDGEDLHFRAWALLRQSEAFVDSCDLGVKQKWLQYYTGR